MALPTAKHRSIDVIKRMCTELAAAAWPISRKRSRTFFCKRRKKKEKMFSSIEILCMKIRIIIIIIIIIHFSFFFFKTLKKKITSMKFVIWHVGNDGASHLISCTFLVSSTVELFESDSLPSHDSSVVISQAEE
jgi:hypothetical protein